MNCPNPTIPGTVQYQACEFVTDETNCGDWYRSCRNPLWALDHPNECGLLTVTQLAIEPSELAVPVGRSARIRVVARFSDGRQADVTDESVIGTSVTGIAQVIGRGVIEGVEIGLSGLTATWKGRLATGTVNVFDNACVASQPWDVIAVVDDGYVNQAAYRSNAFGEPRLTLGRFYAGVDYHQFVFNLVLSLDLLDWGEGWTTGTGGVRTGADHWWNGAVWTNKVAGFAYVPSGGDVGGDLMKAYEAFQSGRPDARKLVVLFTTGDERNCNPGMLGACQALALNGIEVAVVTPLTANSPVYSPCYSNQFALVTAHSILSQCASSSCLFVDGDRGGLAGAMAIPSQLLRMTCEGCSSGVGIGLIGL